MNMKQRIIVGAVAMAAAGSRGGAGGNKFPSLEVLGDVEALTEQMLHDLKGRTPAEAAKACFAAQQRAAQLSSNTFRATCLFLTYFEQQKQAEDFVDAWKAEAEAQATGKVEGAKRAVSVIGQLASRMSRVVRSVWGVRNNENFKALGAEGTRKVLLEKGEIHDVLAKLPTTRERNSGSTKVAQPVQLRRLESLQTELPSAGTLAKALGVVANKNVTPTQQKKIVEGRLAMSIKMCPREELGIVVGALTERLMAEKDYPELQDFGVSIRDGWKATATMMANRKPEKAKAKTKKPATASK